MPFFSRSKKAEPKIQGEFGYHGLSDWWLSTFKEEERQYIESKFHPLGAEDDEKPLTVGHISFSSGTAANLLSVLAGWFDSTHDRHIARRFLEKSDEVGGSVLDRHFTYSAMVPIYYRDRDTDPDALAAAIDACEKQIALGPEAAEAFEAEYPTDSTLPSHRGFTQLAIIREKEHNYADAIRLAQDAMSQGWAGDWEKRIERCEKRLATRG